jgi:hypothetical protein
MDGHQGGLLIFRTRCASLVRIVHGPPPAPSGNVYQFCHHGDGMSGLSR